MRVNRENQIMSFYKFISDFTVLISAVLSVPIIIYSLKIRSWWPTILFFILIIIIDLFAKRYMNKRKTDKEDG